MRETKKLEALQTPALPESMDDANSVAVVQSTKLAEQSRKGPKGSADRDLVLAKVESEKKMSMIHAWEENEKTKVNNKAQKMLSAITSWENSKKATYQADIKKNEEKSEKKKAEYGEKVRNKVAVVHKLAEEKRAMVEAKRGEELLKAEEAAARFRATGVVPKKGIGCFGF